MAPVYTLLMLTAPLWLSSLHVFTAIIMGYGAPKADKGNHWLHCGFAYRDGRLYEISWIQINEISVRYHTCEVNPASARSAAVHERNEAETK